jgi:hypothetical protein
VAKYGGSDGREKLEADAAAQKERDEDVDEHEDPLIIAMQFKKWTGTQVLSPAALSTKGFHSKAGLHHKSRPCAVCQKPRTDCRVAFQAARVASNSHASESTSRTGRRNARFWKSECIKSLGTALKLYFRSADKGCRTSKLKSSSPDLLFLLQTVVVGAAAAPSTRRTSSLESPWRSS